MNRLHEAATVVVAAALRGIGDLSGFVSDVNARVCLGDWEDGCETPVRVLGGGNKPRGRHVGGVFVLAF